jgi:hypothetical protein
MSKKTGGLGRISFLLGSSVLVFMASILFLNSGLFVLRRSISPAGFYIAFAAALFYIAWGARNYFDKKAVIISAILSLVLLGTVFLSLDVAGRFYDLSYDGQAYHQEAIIHLNNGWNPIYSLPLQGEFRRWVNYYAKAPWIYASQVYKTSGHIEQGKAFNFLLILAAFFLSFAAFLAFDEKKRGLALILSIALALNPVSIYQTLSFYVDGQLASLLTALAALSYLCFVRSDRLTLLALSLCTIMVVNAKFTGLIYALIFNAGLGLWFFLKKRGEILKIAGLIAATYLVAVFFIGYNPYVTNTLRNGHPFYPVAGSKAINVYSNKLPANFQNAGRFQKLFTSIFSRTENVFGPNGTTTWKWPFAVSALELATLATADVRIGGFGPWFGGAFLLSCILILLSLPSIFPPRKHPFGSAILGMIIFVSLSVAVNPESWWLRYVPQLWMIPLTAAALSLYAPRKKTNAAFAWILMMALAANIFMVAIPYCRGQSIENIEFNRELQYLAGRPKPVFVNFNNFSSNRLRFIETGIAYKEVDGAPQDQEHLRSFHLVGSETRVWVNDR